MRTTMMTIGMVLLTAACSSGGGSTGTLVGSSTKQDGGASSAPSAPSAPAGPGTATGGSVAPALVGQWYAGRGGTMISYDATTGTFGPASGSGLLFVFNADGTYVKASQTIEDGPCALGEVSTESGTVTMTDSELLFHPTHGNLQELSCGITRDKPLEVQDESLAWSLAPFSVDPSIPALTLTNAAGASSELRKTQ